MTYWLSYGGGVNSTALAVLLCEGVLPELSPWRILFADTGDEKDETYCYVESYFRPYLARHGRALEVTRDKESVLERWERLGVVGSRVLRTCTSHAKIRPIRRHIDAAGPGGVVQLIGIDAGESHRARPSSPDDPFAKCYPLVELGLGRENCAAVIRRAGLPLPVKSGCWHCPFARKREVIDLAIKSPDRFQRIVSLEAASLDIHPLDPGKVRAQWGDRPASEWLALARQVAAQGRLPFDDDEPEDMPCGCYDGGTVREAEARRDVR